MAQKVTEMQKKPNILVIWGDDIGWFNVSAVITEPRNRFKWQ